MTTVLLLEDNPDMLAMLGQVLEWGGYEVVKGRDGNDGVNLLQEMQPLPNVIISDLSMPVMDGFDLLAHVRNTPEWAQIPFVIMSAHSSPDDRRNALEQGQMNFWSSRLAWKIFNVSCSAGSKT